MTRTLLVAVAFSVVGSSAYAQSSIGARGYATFGSTSFAAADSFDAVAGTSSDAGWGGGGTVTGLWRGLFVDVGLSQQRLDGQRVFLNAGTVYPLDIPLSVTMQPIDLAAGWRFAQRVSPFAGAGFTSISYKETGGFAGAGDDVDERKSGLLVLGGVDVGVVRWLHVGGEVRYRNVSGIIGGAGVSSAFGDDQLGGFSTALRISVGR